MARRPPISSRLAAARLWSPGRPEKVGEAVVRDIEAAGGVAMFVQANVDSPADVEALVAKTVELYGRLDLAVNSAGIGGPAQALIAEIEEADWDAVLETNLKSVWRCMKFEIRAMLAGGGGSIVGIVSSIYGYKPQRCPGHTPYCVAKLRRHRPDEERGGRLRPARHPGERRLPGPVSLRDG